MYCDPLQAEDDLLCIYVLLVPRMRDALFLRGRYQELPNRNWQRKNPLTQY